MPHAVTIFSPSGPSFLRKRTMRVSSVRSKPSYVVVAPDLLEQERAAERAARMPGEKGQQLEFFRGQVKLDAAGRDECRGQASRSYSARRGRTGMRR